MASGNQATSGTRSKFITLSNLHVVGQGMDRHGENRRNRQGKRRVSLREVRTRGASRTRSAHSALPAMWLRHLRAAEPAICISKTGRKRTFQNTGDLKWRRLHGVSEKPSDA